MLAALVLAIHGLGAIMGADFSLSGVLGVSATVEGWIHLILGVIGVGLMATHCRCEECQAAPGNMEPKCDNCMACKGGCTGHEM